LGDIARCRELGIAAYIMKPITQSDLFDRDRAWCSDPTARRHGLCRRNRQAPAADSRGTAAVSLHVLLAEDNVVNQRLAIRLLEKRGHQVTLRRRRPRGSPRNSNAAGSTLSLMDLQMPHLDGLEATAEIRRREQETGHRLPIIAMTAHAMKGDREQCLAAGMDAYIAKPIQAEDLTKLWSPFTPTTQTSHVSKNSEVSPVTELIDWNAAPQKYRRRPRFASRDHRPLPRNDFPLAERLASRNHRARRRVVATHSPYLEGSLSQLGALSARDVAQQLEMQAAKINSRLPLTP